MSTLSEPIAAGNPSLNYKVFGRKTGLRVSELALGVGMFGTRWGHGATPAEARQVVDGYAGLRYAGEWHSGVVSIRQYRPDGRADKHVEGRN